MTESMNTLLKDSLQTVNVDGEDDEGSTALLEVEELSVPSTRSRYRRRKALQHKRQQQETGATHVNQATMGVQEKAVQTEEVADTERIKTLETKVKTLEEMVNSLVTSRMQQETQPSAASSSHSSPLPVDRIEFLEKMEQEHSRLLVLKGRSDCEMMNDLTNLKQFCNEMHGKVEYCLRCLDDSEDQEDAEGEDEDEEEEDDVEAAPSAGDPKFTPVPEDIQRLPYPERMRRLGYISDKPPK